MSDAQTMPAKAESRLFWLWTNGATPRRAMNALRRDYGVRLTIDQVRLRFVALSERG